MSNQLILTIPSGDPALRREIERGVEEYADVRQSDSYSGLETVKLVLEVVGQGVEIAGGVAAIVTFIRSLRQEGLSAPIMVEVPGSPPQPIEEADAELLASLLMSEQPE